MYEAEREVPFSPTLPNAVQYNRQYTAHKQRTAHPGVSSSLAFNSVLISAQWSVHLFHPLSTV